MIHFEGVSYRYPGQADLALEGVNLRFERGEFVLVAGASGSGKSTLLRCINGLVPHFYGGTFGGRVRVCGRDTSAADPRAMSPFVGFVFQDPEAQFVVDSVEDELVFGMENLGVSPPVMRRRVEEVLDQLGIADLRGRAVSTLSGGERQRVAIAAVLTVQPQVLVLDEPTSQLDPQAAEEVFTALERLNDDLGLTVVLSEHRLERVLQHVDRVVHLSGPGAPPVAGSPREMARQMSLVPPVVALGRALGWEPLPLTVKEARAFSRPLALPQARRQPMGDGKGDVLLEVEGLRCSLGRKEVLRGVDLLLREGELVALMGRNGAGKTTLLRAVVGLVRPSGGRVRALGRDASRHSVEELARLVAYVPQNPNSVLFAESLAEEIAFTRRNHEKGAEEAPGLLEALGLERHRDAYPRDLSTGEQQRAAIAAVLAGGQRIILLDEPTRGLDYANKRRLAAFLAARRRAGDAVLMVTHDVELVAEAADRVVLLSEGAVVVDGPVREVLAGSAIFSSQVNKLFGGFLVNLRDVREALGSASGPLLEEAWAD